MKGFLYQVVLWDVNSEANNTVCEEIRSQGGRATAFTCDLSDKDQIYQTAARVSKMNEWFIMMDIILTSTMVN